MKKYLTKENLPMLMVIGMVAWAWLSFISTLLAKLF